MRAWAYGRIEFSGFGDTEPNRETILGSALLRSTKDVFIMNSSKNKNPLPILYTPLSFVNGHAETAKTLSHVWPKNSSNKPRRLTRAFKSLIFNENCFRIGWTCVWQMA